MDIDVKITKFRWRIENFSSIKDQDLYSETFTVDGNKWRVLVKLPRGSNVDLPIYLEVADSTTLPSGWSRYAEFRFAIINQFDRQNSLTEVTEHEFEAGDTDWGFASFVHRRTLYNRKRGYLVNDACIIEAYISTERAHKGLISHELIVENDWGGNNKTKVADFVKATTESQKATITKFRWRIENFSCTEDERLDSEDFIVDGNKWKLLVYPKGDDGDHLSIYLIVPNSATLPSGWSRYAQFGFVIVDQFDRKTSIIEVTEDEFNEGRVGYGVSSVLALSELHNPKRGYLVDDTCLVEVYVSTDRTKGLISCGLIVENDLDEHKIKESDCVNGPTDNQNTTITKSAEIATPSPTRLPSQSVACEPEEPTEEDMATFFTSLESDLSSSNIVYSQEEAKEALAKLDEALKVTPANLYDSGKYSPQLKQSFKILARFYYSSTTLTVQQKNELLSMEERLKELADRAAKAMQGKHYLTVKESTMMMITRNLDRNLIRYKEVESELKEVEQKLAALLSERKGIFESSKEMKMELERLRKEWAEDEAKSKVYEEEEKIVESEWGRMKDFISSIKEKI